MDPSTRLAIDAEISAVETALQRRLEVIMSEASSLMLEAAREAQRQIFPLMSYLETQSRSTSPTGPKGTGPGRQTALERLLIALEGKAKGVHKKELDAFITSDGLDVTSARKARYVAESQGLVSKQGSIFRITAAGKLRLEQRHST